MIKPLKELLLHIMHKAMLVIITKDMDNKMIIKITQTIKATTLKEAAATTTTIRRATIITEDDHFEYAQQLSTAFIFI